MTNFAKDGAVSRHPSRPAAMPGRRHPSAGGLRMLDALSLLAAEPAPGVWFGELGPLHAVKAGPPADPIALLDRLSLTRRP